ncbi:uncharacterized protein LOC141685809 [Apium graveolens]|uniref:uncharacterized protein LOC141685809 n=1 Tax=Apium graveolens TaxID=4045 RepID=UPI003D7A70D0
MGFWPVMGLRLPAFDRKRRKKYKVGVQNFIKFALEHLEEENNDLIRCPCTECGKEYYKNPSTVKPDLYRHGIMKWYTRLDCHGEKDVPYVEVGTSSNYKDDVMYDAHDDDDIEDCENFDEEPIEITKIFYKMLNAASEPIYPNISKFTTLEFSMKLSEWKNKHNCSNSGFDDLLYLIGLILPDDHKFPDKYHTVRKMIQELHMEYEKIDACENEFMLFYKKHSDKTKCDICNKDRYQKQKDLKKYNILRKILRYFPIIMRLQHLFMDEKTAKCMRWHNDRITVEGELSYPADGDEWKQFDRRFQSFSKEIQNVRLGLSIDEFDPFRDKYAKEYTVWPMVVIVYNLPSSMCTKAPYMFMPLLIPGPKDPTKGLHVYLRPLIDELKMLWHTGVEKYDMFSHTNFIMKAAFL